MFLKKEPDSLNSKTLNVQDICFSQRTISDKFQDGTLLSELSYELLQGNILAKNIDPIHVVRFRNQWITMDNRRLRVFKDTFIQEVPVIICDLKNKEVAHEFNQKLTNKTMNGGGEIKKTHPMDNSDSEDDFPLPLPMHKEQKSTQHFTEGAFVFTKAVLNWTFEQLKEPLAVLKHTDSLPDRFTNIYSYYEGFKNLILEETRASIQNGIETLNPAEKISVKLIKTKFANNTENPSPFNFVRLYRNDPILKSGSAVLMVHPRNQTLRFLGISTYIKSELENLIQLKLVIDEYERFEHNDELQANSEWLLYDIGPLVTYQRMYDVCCVKPDVPFLNELISGSLDHEKSSPPKSLPFLDAMLMDDLSEDLSDDEQNSSDELTFDNLTLNSNSLNDSQCEAIRKFLQDKEKIQFVQGPPGTGKTTMIVHLLAELALRKKRVLVCAPSNKAIQEIATRFIEKYPDVPAAFSGVEDKLPESSTLNKIFIHTMGQQWLDDLTRLKNNLWELIPKENSKKYRNQLKNKILNGCNSLENHFSATIKQYQLDSLDDYEKYIRLIQQAREKMIKFISNKRITISMSKNQLIFKNHLSEYTQLLNNLSEIVLQHINDDSDNGLEVQLVNGANVVFATLSVAGRKTFKLSESFQYLIVDEASQAVEAELIIPFLTKPRRCLFIGDTNQLSATVMSEAAKLKNFDRSLIHRFIEDLKQPCTLLNIQYRMDPMISHFPINQFYSSKVSNDPSVADVNRVPLELRSTIEALGVYNFVHVDGHEEKVGKSWINRSESSLIEQYISYLSKTMNVDVASHIGIITFYKAQSNYLAKRLSNYQGLKIQTVDSFQGCENNIIIISFVRANVHSQVGFLKDMRRLNVAMTRAKFALLMIGHTKSLKNSVEVLNDLILHVNKQGCLIDEKDFRQLMGNIQAPSSKQFLSQARHKAPKNSSEMKSPHANLKKPYKASSSSNTPPSCRFFNGKPNSCYKGARCEFSHIKPGV